jgi:hypothetical protein
MYIVLYLHTLLLVINKVEFPRNLASLVPVCVYLRFPEYDIAPLLVEFDKRTEQKNVVPVCHILKTSMSLFRWCSA